MKTSLFTVPIVTLFTAAQISSAAILLVNDDAPAGGDGQTWSSAYQYLQDALTAARNSGGTITEIWVAAGAYKPDKGTGQQAGNRAATFQLISGVALRGGFAGNENPSTFDLSNREFVANPTVLSGDLTGNDGPNFANTAENSFHVLTGSATSAAILDGFVVSGGSALAVSPNNSGAGMYISSGNPTLINCEFIGNRAFSTGAGLFATTASPTVTNCAFIGNYAYSGGAVANTSSSNMTLINCTMAGNSASTGSGFLNSASTATLTNCILWGNTLSQISGTPTVTYSCIQGGFTGQGNTSADPLLLSPATGNIHLRRGSPCIDAGNSAVLSSTIATDLDGKPRRIDDPEMIDTGNPPTPMVDMGAYEYQPAPAERLFVNSASPAGGTGANWGTAYQHLQDALAAAQVRPNVTEIWVATGSYRPDRDATHPSGSASRTATFQLLSGVALRGAFAGIEDPVTFDLAQRDFVANLSSLTGDLAGNDGPNFTNNGENCYHVVTGSGTSASAIFDGFMVTGGNANSTSPHNNGGGMYNNGSPTLSNCVFNGNSAVSGGGIYNLGSSSTLSNCQLITNLASTSGAGMYDSSCHINLTDCVISTNTVASGSGGGIYESSGVLTLNRCVFRGNNMTTGDGAGIYANYSTTTVTNCTFTANWPTYGGSGIGLLGGSASLINCTLAGNMGAAAVYANSNGQMSLTNCIVWANSLTTANGGTINVSYSCVQNGYAGQTNISADPRLLYVAGGNLKLRRGSPCVDAGNNAALGEDATTDLGGSSRFIDDPDTTDSGSVGSLPRPVVDMGAYEFNPVPAERVFVKSAAAPGGDGTSWATAFQNLRDGLVAAQTRAGITEVWVAGGLYKPDQDALHPGGSGDRSATFGLPGGVAVYGGFPGQLGQEDDLSVRDPATFESLLSGDLAGNDDANLANNSENSYHVVTASYTGASSRFDGFTIAAGHANGTVFDKYGGGIYNGNGTCILANCTVRDNVAASAGGGLYSPADGTVTGCSFNRNSVSSGYGGGMYVFGTTNINGCTFDSNYASAGGGGMCIKPSNPVLTNCSFVGNSTAGNGAGLLNDTRGNPVLTGCTFSGNSGAGMYNVSGAHATLTNCTFSANTGGIYDSSSTATLTNCIVWGNTSYQITGSATVTYSCVQGGWTGQGNIDLDPVLLSPSGGDLRLHRGSPCIDAGNNSAVPASLTQDRAGGPRFYDDPDTIDTGNAGSPPNVVVDMGAFEYQPVAPQRLYVRQDAPTGGDGTSWARACQHLQDGLTAARARAGVTEMWVARGVYKPDRDAAHPTGTRDRTSTFAIVTAISMRGGFAGNEDPNSFDPSNRNLQMNRTVLSGDLSGNDAPNFGNITDNSYHVVTSNGNMPTCLMDGFTVMGGGATGSSSYGGGVYMSNSSASFINCIFTLNYAIYDGAGIYGTSGNPYFFNCTFNGNRSTSGYGGGLCTSGDPILINCTFARSYSPLGGAIKSRSGNPSLVNCIVWDSYVDGPATVSYSCIGGFAGQKNITADPRMMFFPDGSVRLRRGSPCIDAGSNDAIPANVAHDGGGGPRFIDDPETTDSGDKDNLPRPAVDMGAYEYQPAADQRLFVKADAPAGGDGKSWSTAYRFLKDGISAAQIGAGVTEIWVSAGTYKPDRDAAHPMGTADRTASFQLLSGVIFRGGFAGNEDPSTFDLSQRRFQFNRSVLSGDLAGNDQSNFVNNSENSYHVVSDFDPSTTKVLDGFTISGGNANGLSSDGWGGGMFLSTSLTVLNCTFQNNSAKLYGGGVYQAGGTWTFVNCIFSGNAASSFGGGLYSGGSSSTFVNCCLIGNSAPTGAGGGIYSDHGKSTLTNCNLSVNAGGGFVNGYGSPPTILTNCIAWGNLGVQIAGSATVTYSCVQGGWTGQGNISDDPRFVSSASGDLHLNTASPCIDAGRNASVPASTIRDLDQHVRLINNPTTIDCPQAPGTCGNAPIVDMGPYEFIPSIPGDFNHDGFLDPKDLFVLRACASGPTVPHPVVDCQPADFDRDGDVDMDDFGIFQRCYSGEGNPADPNCQ